MKLTVKEFIALALLIYGAILSFILVNSMFMENPYKGNSGNVASNNLSLTILASTCILSAVLLIISGSGKSK